VREREKDICFFIYIHLLNFFLTCPIEEILHKFYMWTIITYRCQHPWIKLYNLPFFNFKYLTFFSFEIKNLIQMESLWLDGLYIKIYNKTLIVQVNKEDRVVFFLVWNLFPWQYKRRLDHHHLVIRSELPATVQYRYLSDDSRINARSAYQNATFFF